MGIQAIGGASSAFNSVNQLIATQLANSQRLFGLLAVQLATNDRLAGYPGLDVSAFAASEGIRSQLAGLDAAGSSLQLGRAVTRLAEGQLAGVSGQLDGLRSLVIQASVATGDDRATLNAAIQSSVSQIESQLSRPLFGGSGPNPASFQTTTDPAGNITNLVITQAPNPVPAGGIPVDITVNAAGTSAEAAIQNAGGIAAGGQILVQSESGSLTLTATGNIQDLANQINASTGSTGLTATVNGADLEVSTTTAGSGQVIGFVNLGATGFTLSSNTAGTDADVTVNGAAASANGNVVSFSTGGLAGTFSVDPATPAATSVSLSVESGGITIATDGSGGSITFGLPAFGSSLGASSGLGSLGSIGSQTTEDALAIIDAAQSEVLASRVQAGRVDQRLASASSTVENQVSELTSAFADLRSVDVAGAVVALAQARMQAQLQLLLIQQGSVTQAGILRLLGND